MVTASARDLSAIEPLTQRIGRELFERIGRGPRFWSRAWWDDRLMNATLTDPSVRVQLFRFIDALPALRTSRSVRRHLAEYLEAAGPRVPFWLRAAVRLAPEGTPREQWLASAARLAAGHMAGRFIAGQTPEQALGAVLNLRKQGLAFTADLLGEAVISDREAEAYLHTCLELLRGLSRPLSGLDEIPVIDRDSHGPIPRVNLSIKLSSLTARFDALHAETTAGRVSERFRAILREALRLAVYVHVDMEQYSAKGLTHEVFRQVLMEPEFRAWPHVGIVVQAYLPEAEKDLQELADWAERRGAPITVRLVKGAYWDYEVLSARQAGWPVPVYQQKWRSDASFERCSLLLFQNREWLRPAFGSHNIRSLSHAIATAEVLGVPINGYELQVLHGMGELIQQALAERGHRVRVYTPYGALLPGMAYLVRRLLENTSNDSFLKASFTDAAETEELLRSPEEIGMFRKTQAAPQAQLTLPPFRNEPLTDFAQPAAREAMRSAINTVRSELGESLLDRFAIKGEPLKTAESWTTCDPGDFDQAIGVFPRARSEDAERALAVAREAAPAWGATPAVERAHVLIRAAEIMRKDRFRLAAWEVFECAKPWREADGDVAEAIDFCEFYAREMILLAEPRRRDVAGETNEMAPHPRGVAVVIPPWNFPLAIPCGMTAAALVAGNAVVLKPSERSTRMGLHLAEIFHRAGLPEGVLTVLPGFGDVGRHLVESPSVDLIAFTGSRQVGLEIAGRAAQTPPGQDHVKRVIAEMGGKNAIIIDDDADLDEAVLGVLHSAFGYSGQKCSACSRVIVLEGVHDVFVARLAEALRDLPVGPAEDPDTAVGPVIDARARDSIWEFARIARTEGRAAAQIEIGDLIDKGAYVGPLIVDGVSPQARIAQEEVFGPILAVLKAKDLDDAIAIANGTPYALTGGLYSRSPAHVEQVRRAFHVGNLYINRSITGALVDRQPFGGFKLSGIGTKAGGPDYLREFVLWKCVTENTMRRGFAPEEEHAAASTP